jgi:hypothetical protein
LPKIIELPDGTEAEFPDNMPDSQIEAVLRREYGGGDRTPSVGDMAVGAAQNVDPGSAVGRFASGVWKNINPVEMVKGLGQAVSSPIETGKAVVGQMGEPWEMADHAGAEGRYSEMVGHGLAGSLPLVGPAAAAAGERIGSGDVAGGLGEATGLLAPMAAARPAAALAGRALAPLKARVNPQVAAAAQRQGVTMPAAALSESKLVPLAESLSAKGVGGGRTAARYSEATRLLTEQAEHVVKRASKFTDASEAGQAIAKGLDTFRRQWMKEKARLYKQAELPEKGLKVDASETVRLLDEIIEGKRDAAGILQAGPVADASFYRGLRNGLTRVIEEGKWVGEEFVKTHRRVVRPVEASKLLQAMRELRAKTSASFADPFAAANKGALKKIAATMDDEFRSALDAADPALAQKLRAADAAYKDGLGKINSTFGKQIHKLAQDGKFDKIAGAIANPRVSVDDIPRIVEVVGAEGADGMRMAVLADIVDKAKGAGGQLTPQGVAKGVKRYGRDRLEAILTPEQMAKLDDISTLTGAMEKGTKVMNGSQTAFLAQAAGYPAWFFADPINATLALLGNAAAARFVASPTGQRWLTSGWRVPKGKVAIGAASIGQTGRLAEEERTE